MSYKHGTPGRRLFEFLLDGEGTRTVMEISRRQANGRLLKDAWNELDGLIVEEEGRSARTKRPIRRICLTMKGWAAATFFRPGFVPTRLHIDVLKGWFKELQEEGDEWANSFDRENAVLREKLVEFERLKRDGMIYPSPLLRRVRKDAKNPQAMLERDLRREAREARKNEREQERIHPSLRIPTSSGFGGGFSRPTPIAAYPPAKAPSKLPAGIYDREGFCVWCHGTHEGHAVDCPHKAA
jgi:hypothetical protein